MTIEILLLIVGLAMITFGADFLVEGSSSIARRSGISEFVIGLTIVGIGTSTPEMVVSFMAAFEGNADISVGNIVGSNIFNTFLILGVTALIYPMAITKNTRKRDIPVNIGVTLLLILMGMKATIFGVGKNELTRVDGLILLTLVIVYMYRSIKHDSKEGNDAPGKERTIVASILYILGGLAALIIGGKIFVNSSTAIARMIGVSDKFIAVTILAGGTSMPELATCVVAAIKKKGQLALGNIIGSNIFNILLILGGASLIHPLSFNAFVGPGNWVDLGVLLLSALSFWACAYTGKKNVLDRADGFFFLVVEGGYMTWLIMNI